MRTARYGRPDVASTTRASTGRSTDTRSDWAGSRRYVSSARSTSLAPRATTHREGSYTSATRSEGAEKRDSRSAGTAVSYAPSAAACRSTADASVASSFVATSAPPPPAGPLRLSPVYPPRALEPWRIRQGDGTIVLPAPRGPRLQSPSRAAVAEAAEPGRRTP